MDMKIKIFYILVAVVCLLQLTQAASLIRERRDTVSDAEKTIDDTLGSWKKGVEDFFKSGYETDQIIQSVQDNMKDFGDKVSSSVKDFAKTVQDKTGELVNQAKGS